jgi:hypothetical protein
MEEAQVEDGANLLAEAKSGRRWSLVCIGLREMISAEIRSAVESVRRRRSFGGG